MKTSKLFTVVLVTALMFANMACACAPAGPATDAVGHQHEAMQDSSEHAPCHHQNCEGCEELLDRCATPDYKLASSDRDSRLVGPNPSDLDGPELELAFVDTGQPRASPPSHALSVRYTPALNLRADTPIQRKDQLTE